MSEPIVVRSRWTVDELLAAQRFHLRHGPSRPPIAAVHALCALALVLGAILVVFDRPSPIAVLGVLVGLAWPAAWLVLRTWLVRRHFAKRPDQDLEITWTITEDILHSASTQHDVRFTWALIAQAGVSPEGVLLYPNSRLFHWLPRHGFESDEAWRAFGALVRRQVAKTTAVG